MFKAWPSLGKFLVTLPEELQADFQYICEAVLTFDPHSCLGLPNHALTGVLAGCKALEIDCVGNSYRLVYRIYEKPAPRRVVIFSFAEHDPAYDKAKDRIGKKR